MVKAGIFQLLFEGAEGDEFVSFSFLLALSGNNSKELFESEEQKAMLISSLYTRSDRGSCSSVRGVQFVPKLLLSSLGGSR